MKEESLLSNKLVKPNRAISERITGFDFEYADNQHVFDSLRYISEETIAKAILMPCCPEECLRKKLNSSSQHCYLNFESVYRKVLEARKQLIGNDFKDKMLILKTIIQGKTINLYIHIL